MRATIRWLGLGVALVLAFVVAGILWPVTRAPLPDAARDRLIINARVVDVERGIAGPPTSVLIRNGVIAGIGSRLAEGGAPVLDAGGGYLVPGFWNMHSHAWQISPQLHFPLLIANGVTGVRDMMDCPGPRDTLIACVADKRRWTREVEAGTLVGPRFVEVGSFYFERPDMHPNEAAGLAATYKARGIDALKVYNRVPRPAYFRLAQEARRLDMRLVGHLPQAVSLDKQWWPVKAVSSTRVCFRKLASRARLLGDGAN